MAARPFTELLEAVLRVIRRPSMQAGQDIARPLEDMVRTASNIVTLLVWVIALAILAIVAYFVIRKVIHEINLKKIASMKEETLEKAARCEQRGDYVAAAMLHEKLGNAKKAAALYEQGRSFGRAAHLYAALGQNEKAIELFKRAGESLRAAELCVKTGKYREAAEIFRNKGDRLRAAQALDMAGDKPAAALEYREAGHPLKAARIYKDLRMYKEAGDMAFLAIEGQELGPSNMDKYYTYAALLMMQGEMDRAAGIYRGIVQIDSGFRDVTNKLAAIAAHSEEKVKEAEPAAQPVEQNVEIVEMGRPSEQGEAAPAAREPEAVDDIDSLIQSELEKRDGAASAGAAAPALKEGETTLRGIMKSGRMENRYSMRMWVQVLRTLASYHFKKEFYGTIPPESIIIDMQNNIRIEQAPERMPDYTAPEVLKGSAPDEQSDIYCMGAVLFELITGTTEHLSDRAPSEMAGDVPEWLDELILKCTEREREHRYKTLEDIYAKLIVLKDVM
jgi:tetratricopeptide (TPR) repeat protein